MKTGSLRELIRAGEFLHMPAVYDPLGGLLVQNSGFNVCFHSAAGAGHAMGSIFTAYRNRTPLVITACMTAEPHEAR